MKRRRKPKSDIWDIILIILILASGIGVFITKDKLYDISLTVFGSLILAIITKFIIQKAFRK